MKRTVAALTAITIATSAVAPAVAEEKKVSSSAAYQDCVSELNNLEKTPNGKRFKEQGLAEANAKGSSDEGSCIKLLAGIDEYRGGVIATLVLVPAAILGILAFGAAYFNLIPGFSLPAGIRF